MAKTISFLDALSGGYMGLRAAQPLMLVAKGEWDMDGAMNEYKYRFGFWGSEGFNPWGSIETYGPPIAMQIAKKAIRWAFGKKSLRLGPLRFP